MRILKRLLEKMTENNGKTTEKTTDCKRTGLGLLWRWTERQAAAVPGECFRQALPTCKQPPTGQEGKSSILPGNTATRHAKRK